MKWVYLVYLWRFIYYFFIVVFVVSFIVNIVKSSFGLVGFDKMLVDDIGVSIELWWSL